MYSLIFNSTSDLPLNWHSTGTCIWKLIRVVEWNELPIEIYFIKEMNVFHQHNGSKWILTSTFTGTCISLHLACVQEFSLENRLTEAVRLFLNSPEDRFKHKLPNLYTMIGYVLSLPVNNVMPILGNMFNHAFFVQYTSVN